MPLKQNNSLSRYVTETYIEDEQNLVLQQYLLLSFTYNLKNFNNPENSTLPEGDVMYLLD